MPAQVRPYLFYDTATSLCPVCLRRIEAKLLIEQNQVYLDKWCPQHGHTRVLIADDAEYWRMAREHYLKPPERPLRFNTPQRYGCPYDCGLCPEHMQHSCLSLIELTEQCDLRCPICYADSSPQRNSYRSLADVERMLDALVANEGEPDVLQFSGGEPTLHPELYAILDAAKARPIRHIMLNTNGVRLAREPELVQRLAQYQPGFEIYLQFDGLDDQVYQTLRGAKLWALKQQALELLNRYQLSTTLVMTVAKGVNDQHIGAVLDYALQQPCVRGVTLQPVQDAGRCEGYDVQTQRLTLTEVRRRVLEQHSLFSADDIVPVPCNSDALAMAYALKWQGRLQPLSGLIGRETLLNSRASITLERDPALREQLVRLFSTNHSPEGQALQLGRLLCCLPFIKAPELSYQNIFRLLIVQFADAHSFDLRAIKRSCVHIVQPDGRLIPFETYNLFYRGEREAVLAERRAELAKFWGNDERF